MFYIGLDIGGTKISGVAFDGKKVLASKKIFTELNEKSFENEIIDLIAELAKGRKINGIGMGLPGILDREKGVIIKMPNIPNIKNLNLKKIIEKKFKTKLKIENDANSIALAEYLLGAGKGTKHLLCLTLGTGLGGGIIADGKMYIGRANAAELGHINIEPEGFQCTCGNKGCFEQYASGQAVKRFAAELGIEGKPKEIEDRARVGDEKALQVYKKIGYYLGVGIASLIVTLDPDLIVLSGSITNAADLYLKETKNEVKKRVFFPPCEIKISKLKDITALGAACLFLKNGNN